MTDRIDIRAVERADLAAVRTMLIETWHDTYDDIYGAPRVDEITARWHSLDILLAQMQREDSAFLMAMDAAGVVASSYAYLEAAEEVHLSRLYVLPRAQRTGIGRRLLDTTLGRFEVARTQRLEVEPANHNAIAFYERVGFKRVGSTSNCGGASGVPALIYERQVR